MEQEHRIRKSRAALKQALLDLMKRKKFQKITIKELCVQAGLNRSTFYANYEDINHLLWEVHRDVFKKMTEALGGIWRIGQEDRLEPMTRIIHYLADNQEVFLLLLSNNEENLFEKHMTDYYMELYLPKEADCRQRYVFLYHTIGSFSLVSRWLWEQKPCPPRELAELICSMSESAKTGF